MEEHIQTQALQPGTFSSACPLLSGSVEPSLAFQHASDVAAHIEEHLQQVGAWSCGGWVHVFVCVSACST
jgi:hypothetical protein